MAKDKTPTLEVTWEDLTASKIKVLVEGKEMFYLDPSRVQGEFVLRPIPSPVVREPVELPDEWRKPTKEEVAAQENKIDWAVKPDESDTEEEEPTE